MSKYMWIAAVLVLIIGVGAFVYGGRGSEEVVSVPGGGKLDGNPVNFSQKGVVLSESVRSGRAELFFSYAQTEGSASSSAKLVFDPISSCGGSGGYLPCVAMSVTLDVPFGGKEAIVEGLLRKDADGTDEILVRKLQRVEAGERAIAPAPGSVFITWPQAVDFIRSCAPTSVMQTHAHDVYLEMQGGERLRSVEPVIDEVFRVVDEAREECGSIPVATE